MELLTPREMSQTTETRLPAETNRVTIPDPSDTLGDPVVEQTVRKLIETAGRLVANKNAPGSGVTAPYGTVDDTGRVQLSQTVIRQGISNVTPLMGNSRIPERKVRKMPAWKQRPGIGGVAALPPAVSQIPGKFLCFLVTRATEKQHVDPENLVLSLTRLRDFLVEMDVKELSLPVYDPNRGRLHPRELYALVHVIFSDTNIQIYLHKKYYLSIG